MKKINSSSYYSLRKAIEFTPFSSKETLARYINRYQGASWSIGKIWIKKREIGKGKTSVRYIISGNWIREFNKLYKAGKLNEHTIFTPDELRYTLKDIINYCKKNKIETIQEFVTKKQNEEEKSVPPARNR